MTIRKNASAKIVFHTLFTGIQQVFYIPPVSPLFLTPNRLKNVKFKAES